MLVLENTSKRWRKVATNQLSRFIPNRLSQAREARGLTVTELANIIGTSHQTISKYENSKSVPSYDTLERLSNALRVPVYYFFKDVTFTSNKVIFFRGRAAATTKSKRIHQRRLEWLKEVHKYLERTLDFPKLNLPQLVSNNSFTPTDFEEIDEFSEALRKHWGLGNGPISNVLLLLEKCGLVISRASFPDAKLDACSSWLYDERPYIILSSDKTASRSRFDIAHELGHLILHHYVKENEFNNKENYKRMENEANRFASSFLLPASSFGNEIFSTSLEHLIALKQRWKVSIQAIAYRAYTLGIFSEHQHINIRQKLAKNKWLKHEPLDDELQFEEPLALKQAVNMIIDHNVKSKNDLLFEIGLSAEDLGVISNLEYTYFLEQEKKYNVVSLRR